MLKIPGRRGSTSEGLVPLKREIIRSCANTIGAQRPAKNKTRRVNGLIGCILSPRASLVLRGDLTALARPRQILIETFPLYSTTTSEPLLAKRRFRPLSGTVRFAVSVVGFISEKSFFRKTRTSRISSLEAVT